MAPAWRAHFGLSEEGRRGGEGRGGEGRNLDCAMIPWCHGAVEPWYHGTMAPWRHGTMAPCSHGAMEPWYHGTMVTPHPAPPHPAAGGHAPPAFSALLLLREGEGAPLNLFSVAAAMLGGYDYFFRPRFLKLVILYWILRIKCVWTHFQKVSGPSSNASTILLGKCPVGFEGSRLYYTNPV